jgi:uncharacterized protein DUF1553/uncharacterized protein DUF1549/cytochrome c
MARFPTARLMKTPIRVAGTFSSFLAVSALLLVPPSALAGEEAASDRRARYLRDIKPILVDRCYTCHGPDENTLEADLRFDLRDSAIDYGAIVPGEPDDSLLIERIASDDPDLRMPPPDAYRPVFTPDEIEEFRRWIAAGAEYEQHWAFVPPERPQPPKVKSTAWIANPLDAFVASAHESHGLTPAPEANRRALIRRLSFDLRGLPPTAEEVDAFVADTNPDAYTELVERFLASPRYGERMAVHWLDVVRYADSGGYHSDNARNVWMYRDYVIRAFNENKPFDEFVVEQLAGDLLVDPTDEQRVASGYNRLLQTTQEGGAQPKEYTAKYASDRTSNTAAAFLGVTFACAECHDHKFDPISTHDFYSLAAFFADVKEIPVGHQVETAFPTPEQTEQLGQLDQKTASAKEEVGRQTPELDEALAQWLKELAEKPETAKDLPKEVKAALAVEADKRDDKQKSQLAQHFRSMTPLLAKQRERLADLEKQQATLDSQIARTLITEAVPPRTVRVLPRGNWMDDSGPVVEAAIPAFLGKLDTGGRRATRLELAHWLVEKDNPLVARVLVNRIWKLLMGRGIVATLDDFGSQGALPSHPELLDWLAAELVESGWDMKQVVRLIVMSNTYRQSSDGSQAQRKLDPTNQWFARQNKIRLDAEFVRDNALAIGGLLAGEIGGPSVKPYQPSGYWQHLNFPKRTWTPDQGEAQYRRGLYTWWQRTFIHPSLSAFDAASREQCVVSRTPSNTPLQALVLLNDPTYVEAARKFAERIVRDGGSTLDDRLAFAYRQAVGRVASDEEAQVLSALYQASLDEAQAGQDTDMSQILSVGFAEAATHPNPAELVAWTSVARAILNLHETITRY